MDTDERAQSSDPGQGSLAPPGVPNKKAIRCDRYLPCSNCQKQNLQCSQSPRAPRAKRKRASAATNPEYTEKIDRLDKRLDQMNRFIDALAGDRSSISRHTTDELASNSPAHSTCSAFSVQSVENNVPTGNASQNSLVVCDTIPNTTLSPITKVESPLEQDEGVTTVMEGLSSLSTHSMLAIGFLDQVASADRRKGHSFDTRELLDSLSQIVDAIKSHSTYAAGLFPLARSPALLKPETSTMPPIEVSVAAIRQAEEKHTMMPLFLNVIMGPKALSDICLKVYFSKDYSNAEYILLNMTLYKCFCEDMIQLDETHSGSRADYQQTCQKNLETALSKLPLHIVPSHEIITALVSGAVYAIDLAKPLMAWTLVGAAYQAAYSLGFHTRKPEMPAWCDMTHRSSLLFWTVYYLEKTLSLRLGRCSTIPDFEITVPLPGGSPAMDYFGCCVKLATLAGKVYEKLYSAQALLSLDTDGAQRVQDLSQELDIMHEQSQNALEEWSHTIVHNYQREQLRFASLSDDVFRYTMQTVIHRALSTPRGSPTSFTEQCIAVARRAITCHQLCSAMWTEIRLPCFFASYMSWVILFAPFAPFIVLFCHVVETGQWEDLERMRSFVESIDSSQPESKIVSKHHRLFQIFYEVALRYTQLKTASTPVQDDSLAVSTELDGYLHALGFQLPTATSNTGNPHIPVPQSSYEGSTVGFTGASQEEVTGAAEASLQMPPWFNLSQHMIGLMDSDEMIF
ncbi:putative transcriptional regulatory protein [Paramyrothecium foliicola]|nr:putative transcriptional regulatory protein [Paramyrothecium foliicola]